MPFELAPLPYAFNALEPSIDEETMKLHHGKHHAAYTTNLNNALATEDGKAFASLSIVELLQGIEKLPDSIRNVVRNHGGGYANHNLFWQTMGPQKGGEPSGALAQAIDATFGSFASFKEKFTKAGIGQFGSGWAWLVLDGEKKLQVYSTPNQDSPWMKGHTPLLGLDVWEHAYYKKYGPGRADYAAQWWNVVNWTEVEALYKGAL